MESNQKLEAKLDQEEIKESNKNQEVELDIKEIIKTFHEDKEKAPKAFRFYNQKNKHFQFSNFYPSPINNFLQFYIAVDGVEWPNTEQYYQAQKFPTNPDYQDKIRLAATPGKAFKLAQTRTIPLRKDWNTEKVRVMYRAIKAKFTQHIELRDYLLATGDEYLIEETKRDKFWGNGGISGKGANVLGKLLMILRSELRG